MIEDGGEFLLDVLVYQFVELRLIIESVPVRDLVEWAPFFRIEYLVNRRLFVPELVAKFDAHGFLIIFDACQIF